MKRQIGRYRKKNDTWMFKAPSLLKKKFDYIMTERIRRGKSKIKDLNYKRIGLAIARYDDMIEKLIDADFVKDDNAQLEQHSTIFSIFRFMIIIFIAVIFFAGLIYVMGLLNTALVDVGLQNEVNFNQTGYVNLTNAANVTFGKVNESIQALRLVAITLIFAEIMLMFILNSFRRIHPAMFFIWVLIVFLAVMFAAPISNAYETLLQSDIYEGTLQSFTGANWILLNLPIVVLIVGIAGGIFMFINIMRTGGERAL